MTFKFIDLFAGIGGFRKGFELAGFECIFSSEINQSCRRVYQKNYGEEPFADVRLIDPKKLEDFDILVAGFPCQPFSICGKRQGFQDTRGTLFFDICRIIEQKQPAVVVLENVKYLIHHDKGKTLQIILSSLEDLGYYVTHELINASSFGVPQHRERILIIATKTKPFKFNQLPTIPKVNLKQFLDSDIKDFEVLDKSEYTLIDNSKKQQSGLIFVGYRNKGTWKTGVRPNTEHLSRVHRQPNRIYSIEGLHPTIPSQETSGRFFIYIPEKDLVRKLTIQECYRIMGFPEDFKRADTLGECYKQIGNSVCVPLIKEIALAIKQQKIISNSGHYEPFQKAQKPIQPTFSR